MKANKNTFGYGKGIFYSKVSCSLVVVHVPNEPFIGAHLSVHKGVQACIERYISVISR